VAITYFEKVLPQYAVKDAVNLSIFDYSTLLQFARHFPDPSAVGRFFGASDTAFEHSVSGRHIQCGPPETYSDRAGPTGMPDANARPDRNRPARSR
jgi:hypothetical protein